MKEKKDKRSELDKAVDRMCGELEMHDPESEAATQIVANIKDLNESKAMNDKAREKLNPNVVVTTVGGIVAAVLVGNLERTKILGQKAMAIVMKLIAR